MRPFLFFILLLPFSLPAQSTWEGWDRNYREIDVTALLNREQKYTDSIDSDPQAEKFYVRMDGYRFAGTFTGEWRQISDERKQIMQSTYKLFSGTDSIVDQAQREVEIRLGQETSWMPIQPLLEKAFKREIKKNRNVYLYCLFFNQHTSEGKLYNIFYILEFRKP